MTDPAPGTLRRKTVQIDAYECERCGHVWQPRSTRPRVCPNCKSAYWDTPRKDGKK